MNKDKLIFNLDNSMNLQINAITWNVGGLLHKEQIANIELIPRLKKLWKKCSDSPIMDNQSRMEIENNFGDRLRSDHIWFYSSDFI